MIAQSHFVCLLLALYLSMILLPSNLTAGEVKHNKSNSYSIFSKDEFDINTEKLPRNYIGHDLISVVETLNKILPRSEFETPDAYKKRFSAISSQPILGRLTLGSLYAFAINKLETSYNAENQTLSVSLNSDSSGYDSAVFEVASHYRSTGSYMGVNAFNRKIHVQKGVRSKFTILFYNCHRKFRHYTGDEEHVSRISNTSLKTEFRIGPDAARKAENRISLLLIGKLRPPFVEIKRYQSTPSIDYPYDTETVDQQTHMDVTAMWLYDRSTGKIYKKIDKCTQGGVSEMDNYLF